MKKNMLKLLIPCAIIFTLASCGTKTTSNDKGSEAPSQSQASKEDEKKPEIINLKSQDEFNDYCEKSISQYKKLFEKNGVTYKLSSDNSIIMNESTTRNSLGKEYKTYFSASIGANLTEGKGTTITSTYLTSHIDDKFSKDNKDLLLAFDLLSSNSDLYKDVDAFMDKLNTSLSSMSKEEDKVVLEDSDKVKIYMNKSRNEIKLLIMSSNSVELSYGKIKPMEFSTYEDYKKLMVTTNAEIFDRESQINSVYLGSHPSVDPSGVRTLDSICTFGVKYGDKFDKYSYGITNAQNLDSSSGDFEIKLSMSYEGRPENFKFATEGFAKTLSDKFGYKITSKDIEKFLLSSLELHEFSEGYINEEKNIEKAFFSFYKNSPRYVGNGLPFEGMTGGSGFKLGDSLNIGMSIKIPATVEGKTRR